MAKKINELVQMVNSGDPVLIASAWAEVEKMVPKPCCKDPDRCATRRKRESDEEFRRRHNGISKA